MQNPQKVSKTDDEKLTLSPKIQQAIASLHLEGITLSDESMEDLLLFSNGKLSEEEMINRALSRVQAK